MALTHDYGIAITFTGLSNVVANITPAGGKVFVRNRNTKEVLYIDATARTTTTAAAVTSSKKFTTAFSNNDVIEVGMMGDEFGIATHTVDLTKGGGKITIATTAVSTTTHPNVSL